MTRIERSILISAPVNEVFAYASDHRKWTEWFEGVSEFTPTTATTHGTGARYAYKARMMGLAVNVETEIRDFVVNQGWTGVSTKGVSSRTVWDFQSLGSETRFTYTLEYHLPFPRFSGLVDALIMKPQWEKIIRISLENLKRRVEQAYSPGISPGITPGVSPGKGSHT